METHRGIQMPTDQHTAARHTEAEGLLWDLKTESVNRHRVVVIHDSFVLLREDLLQFCSPVGNKRGSGLLGLHAETRIVKGDPVLAKKLISGFHRGDASKPQLLRQAALPGPE